MKYKNIICIFVSILVLTGCVSNTEFEQDTTVDDDGKIITIELDTDLMNSSHINIWLKDNIEVDADITPLEKYKNGLGTYNLSMVKVGTNYSDEDKYIDETGIKQAFSDFLGEKALKNGKPLLNSVTPTYSEINDETDQIYHYFGSELYRTCISLSSIDIPDSIISTAKVNGEKLINAFKDAGDLSLGNDFNTIYINKETYALYDSYYNQITPHVGIDPSINKLRDSYEEYIYISAYSQIENIPICSYLIYFNEADGTKLRRPNSRFDGSNDYLIPCDSKVDCCLDKTGKIKDIRMFNFIVVGDKVKDNLSLLDINKVLEAFSKKFEKSRTHIKVHRIELAYDGILSDELDEQGRREEYLEPIWTVKYLIDGSYEQKIGINAITGEIYEDYCSQ